MDRPTTATAGPSLPPASTPCQDSNPAERRTTFSSSSPAESVGLPVASQTPGNNNPSSYAADAVRAAMAPHSSDRHPKGKRKRTAAKDKAILEAAYHANAKPDKAARLDIVARVSLNEKEVQIWFQNRRQNDRRKSRPLSPQELAALRYGGMSILSSDSLRPPSSFGLCPTSDYLDMSSPRHMMAALSAAAPTALTEVRLLSPASLASAAPGRSTDAPSESHERRLSHESTAQDAVSQAEERGQPAATPQQKLEADDHQARSRLFPSSSFSSSIGYLSNRWNLCSSFSAPSTSGNGDDSFRRESFSSSASSAGPVLPPPASHFRLSLSLEGKAQVVSSMPSPPHLPPPNPCRAGLNRSHSASPIVTLPPISTLMNSAHCRPGSAASISRPIPLPPRLTRGRSRDVHAWELACDKENQSQEDALAEQAKHESSGSAIAAITLLRSASATSLNGGSPLQPSSSAKRNAPAVARGANKKPRLLGKASSSVARLQSGANEKRPASAGNKDDEKDKPKRSESGHVSLSGNESDKENWSPDEEGRPRYRNYHPHLGSPSTRHGRRPLPSSAGAGKNHAVGSPRRPARRGLHDRPPAGRHPPLMPAAGRANTAPAGGVSRGGDGQRSNRHRGQSVAMDIFEDEGDEGSGRESGSAKKRRAASAPHDDNDNDEVERFMKGLVSPSKKNDVDAVAGLLSLSQGNWR